MNLYVIKDKSEIDQLSKNLKSYHISDNNKKEEITIIDLSKTDYNIEFNFFLSKEENNLYFNFFCLNQEKNKKIIHVNVYHQTEKTYSYIKYHGIGLDESLTNLTFLSVNNIKPLANIYSEQEIKEIIMDSAKFSGIPQIDAANNSFTSAHKLMVGNVNKEELFYLMSLGINEIDSIGILIETLYKSFLIETNGESEIVDYIKKEIDYAKSKRL